MHPIVDFEMTILDNNVGAKGVTIWSRNCKLTHDTVGYFQALLIHLFNPESVAVFSSTMCA